MRRRIAVLVIVAALVLVAGVGSAVVLLARGSGPTAAEAASAKLPAPTPIHWGACTDDESVPPHAQCGTLVAPLDWSHPHGATVRIALSRVRHASSHYRGVIVMNPGGPGGSGLYLPGLAAAVPTDVDKDYDWIGFDPRGVGASRPALRCDPAYVTGPRPDYAPTPTTRPAWIARVKAYATACAKNGPILDHMTTVDVATDVDYLRAALGRKTITFYGFSYGTYLGEVYATLFPHHLSRMILDSTVDPQGVWYRGNLDQDVAFEKNMPAFFAWVAKYDSSYHLGTSAAAVRAAFDRERDALRDHPQGTIGSAEWVDLFLSAAYDELYWPQLGKALAEQVHHHNRNALDSTAQYFAETENGYAVYLAVQCTDAPWPRDLAKNLRDATRLATRASYYTWGNAWFNMPCVFWPAKGRSSALQIDGSRAASVLLIDETGDAPTPYSGSLAVRDRFPNARLLAEPGGLSHGETLSSDDRCVSDRIAAYLATGAVPPRAAGDRVPDETCAPPAVPSPE